MKTLLAAAAAAALLSGCLTVATAEGRAQLSSGHIGCMPGEITTSELTEGFGQSGNWEAECHGKRFICSYEQRNHGTEVACAPKL